MNDKQLKRRPIRFCSAIVYNCVSLNKVGGVYHLFWTAIMAACPGLTEADQPLSDQMQ